MRAKWVKNAPPVLVADFEGNKFHKGRHLLERLLCDKQMEEVWKVIQKKGPSRTQLHHLWGAIMTAKGRADSAARMHKPRTDQTDELLSIAKRAGDLGRKIKGTPLDVLAFNLLQHDTLEALGVPGLLDLPEAERQDAAHRLLDCWPSAPEILLGLEKLATNMANEIGSRPALRSSGDVILRKFVRELGPRLRELFGELMYGTLATITNVTFPDVKVGGIDKGFVQQALRGV